MKKLYTKMPEESSVNLRVPLKSHLFNILSYYA